MTTEPRTGSRPWRSAIAIAMAALMIAPNSSASDNAGMTGIAARQAEAADQAGFSVMTYNVKGLPWPVASGRSDAAMAIGKRLARMRQAGAQPRVVLLQEAFGDTGEAIARAGGYRYVAIGPSVATGGAAPLGETYASGARWVRGEGVGSVLGSGLAILSDFPIARSRKQAFPRGACAGFDCLAAKGVLMTWVEVPGMSRPLAIGNTHLNARGAAMVTGARADRANRWQLHAVASAMSDWLAPDEAAIIGGDWNIGKAQARRAAFAATPPLGARQRQDLSDAIAAEPSGKAMTGPDGEADGILARHKDMILSRDGAATRIVATGVSVPFGETHGVVLSDHAGYAIDYRFERTGPAPKAPETVDAPMTDFRKTVEAAS